MSLPIPAGKSLTGSQIARLEKRWPGREYWSYYMDPINKIWKINDVAVTKQEFDRDQAFIDEILDNP